jgi:hypothetical protein
MNNLDKRLTIIDCLIKWRQSYQLFHRLTNNEEDLNKSIDEITGIKKMNWFVPTLEGNYQIHDECTQLNFEPFQELKLISELKNFKNIEDMNKFWDNIECNIAQSLFQINLDKFNSAATTIDAEQRRLKLVEMMLMCNNFYVKGHETQKVAYLNLAKECRKKDAIINWWCEKTVLKTKEPSVDYSLFPLAFNAMKAEFLYLSKPDFIDKIPNNLDAFLAQYHTKDYLQQVKANKLKRINYLMVALLSCVLLTIASMIYAYYHGIENLDENSRLLLLLAAFNIVLIVVGMGIIKEVNKEKNFYDSSVNEEPPL